MRVLRTYVFPFVLGLVVVQSLMVVVDAQNGPTFTIGAAIECAWNQPAPTLGDAAAMWVEATFDQGAPWYVTPTCSGAQSPYQCAFDLPAEARTLGLHVMNYRVGNLEADGTVSYNAPTTHDYRIIPALKGAPAQGVNSIIRKKGGG